MKAANLPHTVGALAAPKTNTLKRKRRFAKLVAVNCRSSLCSGIWWKASEMSVPNRVHGPLDRIRMMFWTRSRRRGSTMRSPWLMKPLTSDRNKSQMSLCFQVLSGRCLLISANLFSVTWSLSACSRSSVQHEASVAQPFAVMRSSSSAHTAGSSSADL